MARARWAAGWAVAIGVASALVAGHATAQTSSTPAAAPGHHATPSSSKQGKDPDVPVGYRPAPGMCRVWLAGVPANQQPAPTDCSSAVRNRPSNGRVLFGDDYVNKKSASTFHPRPDQFASTQFASTDGPTVSVWRVIPALAISGSGIQASGPNATEFGGGSGPESTTVAARGTRDPRATSQDEYEAGYAAGYRDAMNGRRPRFHGVDRTDPGTGATGYAPRASGRGGDGEPGYEQPGGAVVVVPPGQDPRYFNNGRYPPPGRANGVCLDRDGDGWCDDPRFGGAYCRDLDGDGRCDDYPALAGTAYPSSLPEMRAGVDVQQGRGSAIALRWLGTAEVVARLVNPRRTGTPYRVLWYDANRNTLLQTWTDLDGDGIADRVEIFRNGRRVKLLGR